MVGSAAEAVQGPALPLEGIDNVHSSDGLPLGMLSVGNSVADDILQEHLYAQHMQDKTLKGKSPSRHLWSLHRSDH